MSNEDQVGRRLRLTRLALEITEQEAAAGARITLRTYRKWEAGGVPKRNSTLNILCFAEK
jgi:transcriptional regulator with XRE-family HTH domain